METQTNTNSMDPKGYAMKLLSNGGSPQTTEDLKTLFQQNHFDLHGLLERLGVAAGKKSFLVFKNNKYINVLTENIALIYIKNEVSVLMCFDAKEYYVNHSLEQIQNSLSKEKFFRLNRQYLINFNAVKEVEHYFARKMLVNLAVPVKEKLVVSKEKVTSFLHWLDNR